MEFRTLDRRRLVIQLISTLLVALFVVFSQSAQVDGASKISQTEGNFADTLNDQAKFGSAVAPLGDLDGDGFVDAIVGAPLYFDGSLYTGAVWVLRLDNVGSVKSSVRIHEGQGGFTGDLGQVDGFGVSLANVGDLDGDGVVDVAVGANNDDDGGSNFGAVWILFLNSNGTVKAHQKISMLEGNFSGVLDGSTGFGESIASLADMDADGNRELAVSGGGAVWILYLDDDGTVKSHATITAPVAGGELGEIGDLDGNGISELAVGAPTEPGPSYAFGAVYVLFLDASANVLSHQKIDRSEGNFSGVLDTGDQFGRSIAAVKDVDCDGIPDIAVGAPLDDDGGTNRGAVWILHLNSDGTVKWYEKISQRYGEFEGSPANGTEFGDALTCIGDLDGDLNADLFVGSYRDDDGGTDRGAVWTLFLAEQRDAFTVTNTNDSGPGSLREAITAANASVCLNSIVRFDIPGSGPHVIDTATSLPPMNHRGMVDGFSQPGSVPNNNPITSPCNAVLQVQIPSLLIGADDVTVQGLAVRGIDSSYFGTRIQGCFIGTDTTGMAVRTDGGRGLQLGGGLATVGGSKARNRNVIAGNSIFPGVYLDLYTTGNVVEGNLIGLGRDGQTVIANEGFGIEAAGNTDLRIEGNVISGNGDHGIRVSSSMQIQILGNRIGTDCAGNVAVANDGNGIRVSSSDVVQIGMPLSGASNLISGNLEHGIEIVEGSGIWIEGNHVGTDASAMLAIPNLQTGILLDGSNALVESNLVSGNGVGLECRPGTYGRNQQILFNLIGTNGSGSAAIGNTGVGVRDLGSAVLVGNTISGNGSHGIEIASNGGGGQPISSMVRNRIGVGLDVTNPLGNGGHGIYISNTDGIQELRIGSNIAADTNFIAHNAMAGIAIVNTAHGVDIRENRIHDNGGLGIDLGADGRTLNDPGDGDGGPNQKQNFPVLESVFQIEGGVRITGSLDANATTSHTVRFYANTEMDPTRYGEGERYLGSHQLPGVGNFVVELPAPVLAGEWVTATATDGLSFNSSEFAFCEAVLNTPTGSMVSVAPIDAESGASPVTMTFDQVTDDGITTLAMSNDGPASPGGFQLGSPPIYYDLSTSAAFVGTIEVCIAYDETTLPGPESELRLLHYDESAMPPAWEDITTSIDQNANVICGSSSSLSPFAVAAFDGVTAAPIRSVPVRLLANAPNPFNPRTMIRFEVGMPSTRVSLAIFDSRGRLITRLFDGVKDAGLHEVPWNGTDASGRRLGSGVYRLRIQAAGVEDSRSLLLLE